MLTMMGAREVTEARSAMLAALTPGAAGVDWETRAGSLDWTCRETAAHIAHDLLAYATQLTARAQDDYLPLDLVIRPEATPARLLQIAAGCADLLVAALHASGPTDRAWHWGPTDPSGFAALGVNEILLHTHDIATGLRIDWTMPSALCAAVLDRLFPDAPGGDPVPALLWCTGRAALPGRPRLTSWNLRAALD